MENAFLKKLEEIIEENLSDSGFGVEQLAAKMSMSYSSLWRRVSKYTGKSANQFIKEIRLGKAMEILRKEDVTISEVAYRTGFNSPNYFSTCFLDFFGYSPGELKKLGNNIPKETEIAVDGEKVRLKGKSSIDYLKKVQLSWKFLAAAFVVIIAGAMVFGIDWGEENYPSIAVLYPRNINGDPVTGSFCGGLQEQMSNELSRVGKIEVRSRVSSDLFRDKTTGMRKIGRKLKADYIVASNVNRIDDDITVRIALVEAKKDNNVWVQPYQRRLGNQFDLQNEIVADAVWEIARVLVPGKTETSRVKNAYKPEAETLCRQGDFYSRTLNLRLDLAYDCFHRAIQIDSSCAEAYIGLASILNQMYSDIEIRNDTMLDASLRAIGKAEKLNGKLTGLHNQRGMWLFLSGDYAAALDQYNKELGINHESTEALMNMSRALMSLGMQDKAENSINKYFEMESYSTLPNCYLGYIYELKREFKKAQKRYDLASAREPTYGPSILGRVEILLKSGKEVTDVRAVLDSLVQPDYRSCLDSMSITYEYAMLDIYQGKYKDAIGRFTHWIRVTAKSPPWYFRPRYLIQAEAYGYLGDHKLEHQYYDSTRIFIDGLQQISESIRNEARVSSALGIAYAGLGQKSKALEMAERTEEILTENPDAWLGPYAMEDVAFIYAKSGNYTDSFDILRKLLTDSGPLTISLLELDPRWSKLREQPEYLELRQEFGE